MIATSLPPSITLSSKKQPDSAAVSSREIEIYVHPPAIPVSYAAVRRELPFILKQFAETHGGKRPDVIIHMGIASSRDYYSVETLAHRDDYNITDVDGVIGYEYGEKIWKDQGFPPVLKPGLADQADRTEAGSKPRVVPYPPDEHILQIWQSFAPPQAELRLSNDAGRYLCEFIFYSSLAQALAENRARSVVFFHVPADTDTDSLELGREVAVALIKSLVTCWIDEAETAGVRSSES